MDYLCPGCLFFDKQSILKINKFANCSECEKKYLTTNHKIYKAFAIHNKSGSKCNKCCRFIPQPLDYSDLIICPYMDCDFSGSFSKLNRMNHPTTKTNLFLSKAIDKDKISKIKSIIQDQKSALFYNSNDSTKLNKSLIYESILNIFRDNENDFSNYLLNNSKSNGFQHHIFQEYISLLEKSLPYTYKINSDSFKIESILDKNLNIFDGISEFESHINNKFEVLNLTKEYYIGGRDGVCTKPFFIGKLLDIIDLQTNLSILKCVKNYNFSKITFNNFKSSHVKVIHLRIPPHHGVGALGRISVILEKIKNEINQI